MPEIDHNPNPAEVDAFLAARGTDTPTTELPLSAEDLGAAPSEAAPDKFVPTKDPRFNAKTESTPSLLDRLHAETQPFSREQISLTAQEKEAYLKAVMFDQPVEFVLTLPGSPGITGRIGSRTTFESDVVFRAVKQKMDEGEIRDPAIYMTYLQQYSACFQLRELCGQPIKDALRFSGPEGEPAPVTRLLEAHARIIAPMNGPRWAVALRLLSLFEAKLAAAADGLVNGDFTAPASSGS